jgi:gliding motility-associated-like protein
MKTVYRFILSTTVLLTFSIERGFCDPNKRPMTPCAFSVSKSVTDVNCFGGSDGTATINIIGVNAPFVIEWFNGESTTMIDDLSAGTFFVKVTDNTGCFSNYFVTINQPTKIEHQIIPSHVQCYGQPDGSVNLIVSGGTTPYNYQWIPTGENTQDISNLVAGEYKVTITDANNCDAKDSTTLTEPPALISSHIVADVQCNAGNDGEINLTVSGGIPVYSYDWSNGDTLQDVYDLIAGTYTVTITDDHNCELIQSIVVNEPLPLTTSFDVTDVKCYNGTDGAIDMTANGGTTPYTFVWSNPQIILGDITEDLDSIPMNTYYIQITDAHNCYHIDSTEVKQSILLITNIDATYVTCYDSSNGAADLTVTGGTLPYSYLWNNGAITQDLLNVKSNIYSVTIADSNGCTAVASIDIRQPDNLSLGFEISEVSCKDNDDGSVVLYATGATAPYQFSWSNGQTTQNIADLLGGLYTVSITDQQNCPYTATVEVPTNPKECIDLVSIPSGFSPNGDGINDVWIIRHSELYPQLDLKIVNRWGETIFSSTGYSNPWDGTHKGKDLGAATYYYVINLGNGDAPFAGSITIVR